MQLTFLKFFLSYVFKSKTRQHLILMAMLGLVLSSFSLLVIQSSLQGLQQKRIEKSKEIKGHYILKVRGQYGKVITFLKEKKVNKFSREFILEGLIRKSPYITAVIFHGLDSRDYIPYFLPRNIGRFSFYSSFYLFSKFQGLYKDEIEMISPAHTDVFFGDRPRSKILSLELGVNTGEPELDEYHAWGDIRTVQSITKSKRYNRIRIYEKLNKNLRNTLKNSFNLQVISWESENSSLVYALALENNLMIFLFMATVILVILMIGGGLSIFYNRIKQDFTTFWIIGLPLKEIQILGIVNISIITISSLSIGNILGTIFLIFLKEYSPIIMPSMFVERSLPIVFELNSYIFSFFIPFVITLIFTLYFNRRFFKRKLNFIQLIKGSNH